jgi:hypothetical protein
MARVIPRSLKDPVGFIPSSLRKSPRLEELLRAGPSHAQVERLERQDGVDETVSSRSFDIR